MISISLNVATNIRVLINEIRDTVPYELLPLLSLLEVQINSLLVDDGLVVELITLLSSCEKSNSDNNNAATIKKEDDDTERLYTPLILALNDIRLQECMINSNRIRR